MQFKFMGLKKCITYLNDHTMYPRTNNEGYVSKLVAKSQLMTISWTSPPVWCLQFLRLSGAWPAETCSTAGFAVCLLSVVCQFS